MEKQKIDVKASLTYKEVISYLKDFVKSLESGKIVVQSGGEHVTLVPTENVHVKVQAKTKKDKQKLSFEISWCAPLETDLTIGDVEPEVPAASVVEPAPVAVAETKAEAAKAKAPAAPEEKKKDKKKEKKKEPKDKKKKSKSEKK